MSSSSDRLPELAGASVETRASWLVASVALVILSFSYGAPLVTAVALKPIAEELGSSRSLPALAAPMTCIGAGVGGIAMGWLAERIGVRWTVMFGGVMIGAGLAFRPRADLAARLRACRRGRARSAAAGIFAPLMTYISRWFDRRRGTAMALISSGQYVAGALWPALFELGIAHFGWRHTMLAIRHRCDSSPSCRWRRSSCAVRPRRRRSAPPCRAAWRPASLGLPPNVICALLGFAVFCCCMTDVDADGAHGRFLQRHRDHARAWRGYAVAAAGLRSSSAGSSGAGWPTGSAASDRPRGLGVPGDGNGRFPRDPGRDRPFTVAAFFGLGFGGIVPAYVLAVCELFPVRNGLAHSDHGCCSRLAGMAGGGWLAGVIYDYFGFYAPAFAVGVAFNIANLFVILWLIARRRASRVPALAA